MPHFVTLAATRSSRSPHFLLLLINVASPAAEVRHEIYRPEPTPITAQPLASASLSPAIHHQSLSPSQKSTKITTKPQMDDETVEPLKQCEGYDEEFGSCVFPPCTVCVPKDCEFSEWDQWVELGGCIALQMRSRLFKRVNNECGAPCEGIKEMSRRSPHIRPECKEPSVDCKFGVWGDWSVCHSGRGQSFRKREIIQQPEKGGSACVGHLEATKSCDGIRGRGDCVFDDWQAWTACSVTCGVGRHTRMRRIMTESVNGGAPCAGATLMITECGHNHPCLDEDCIMGDWGDWSTCNGDSVQKFRGRNVLRYAAGLGEPCKNASRETAPCIDSSPVDCSLSDWAEWTNCDKTCDGGQKFRRRELVRLMNTHGSCRLQPLEVTEACNTLPCKGPDDCVMGPWSEWQGCFPECGQGSTERSRKVFSLADPFGKGCETALKETKPCVKADCTGKVDCLWTDWNDWSDCSCTCGGGSKRRNRVVKQVPQNGGKLCVAQAKGEARPCNTQPCGKVCIDGKWATWTDWSICSSTCGSGYRSRSRDVEREANGCGTPISGVSFEYSACPHALPKCIPDEDCIVADWSSWSDCSCSCFGIMERSRYISQFVSGNGKPCKDTGLKEIAPCNPNRGMPASEECGNIPAVNCTWGDWEEWNECSRTCGGGQQERSRKIKTHSSGGGEPCKGSSLYVAPCIGIKPCAFQGCEDCMWGKWGDWSECSKSRQRSRHRSIQQLPNLCGKPCDHRIAKEMTNCTNLHVEKVLSCRWSDWSVQSGCGKLCGPATATRSRILGFHHSTTDSRDFIFQGSKKAICTGAQLSLESCERPASCASMTCVAKDCVFSAWSDWGPPSCEGLCERKRDISSMNNECGAPCSGSLVSTMVCPALCNEPEPCVWSDWTDWSECSSPFGQRTKARTILRHARNGAMPCDGPTTKTRPCSKIAEPTDCTLSSWTHFKSCSKTCGGGVQKRIRRIIEHATWGGDPCYGPLEEANNCNERPCNKIVLPCTFNDWGDWSSCKPDGQRYRSRKPIVEKGQREACVGDVEQMETCSDVEVVDCVMGSWTAWDACDKLCGGGQQSRQRQIQVFSKNGGQKCMPDLMETRGCAMQACAYRDCKVTDWSAWSVCTVSCGLGQTTRNRSFAHFRVEGGTGCDESLVETTSCTGAAKASDCMVLDCAWEDWSDWSGCTCTCDGGMKTRNRHIKQSPRSGGKSCEAQTKEEVTPCNTQKCDVICTDGAFSQWSDWSQCTATCGGGTKYRQRKIEVVANACGKPPEGKEHESLICNIKTLCDASVDCEFGSWGEWSDCTSSCDGVKRRERRIDQYGYGYGSYCVGPLKETSPCSPGLDLTDPLLKACGGPHYPTDCQLKDWSDWSSQCSASCGGGLHTRNRDVVIQPRYGGKPCDSPTAVVRQCNTQPCHGPPPVDCAISDWSHWGGCYKCGGVRKRYRQVVRYPKNNGKDCPHTSMEEVGRCDQTCGTTLYCTWQDWGDWGSCSAVCGTGKRSRKRYLTSNTVPAAIPQSTRQIMAKYNSLLDRQKVLQNSRMQELIFAFACGGASLVVGLGWWRLSTRRTRQRQAQLLPSDENPFEHQVDDETRLPLGGVE